MATKGISFHSLRPLQCSESTDSLPRSSLKVLQDRSNGTPASISAHLREPHHRHSLQLVALIFSLLETGHLAEASNAAPFLVLGCTLLPTFHRPEASAASDCLPYSAWSMVAKAVTCCFRWTIHRVERHRENKHSPELAATKVGIRWETNRGSPSVPCDCC